MKYTTLENIHLYGMEFVKLPPSHIAVGCKWVYKRKVDASSSVRCYKARFVARGWLQKRGLDYDETFCLVFRFESNQTVIALGVQKDLTFHQME